MYKIFTSLWSSNTSSSQIDNQTPFESETFVDEDDWVFVAPKTKSIDQTTPASIVNQHFNPIENLLIEHASMSVYEQIACRTRQRKTFADNEEITNDDNQTSMIFQYQSQYPIDQQNLNVSLTDSTMDSSTTNRHVNRVHQRRKRSSKSNHIDKSIYLINKALERQRFTSARTQKFTLHQPFRSNH